MLLLSLPLFLLCCTTFKLVYMDFCQHVCT